MTTTLVVVATRRADRALRHARLLISSLTEAGEPVEVLDWLDAPWGEALPDPVTVHHPSTRTDGLVALAARLPGASRLRLVDRARSVEIHRLLRRHRHARVVLDGVAARQAGPWLRHHRGPVTWVVHLGEELPTPISDDGCRVETVVAGPVPVEVEPGRPPVVAIRSAPSLAAGADLVPRVLWALDRGPARGATVRWLTDGVEALPPEVGQDLRRLGQRGRVERRAASDPTVDLTGVDVALWLDRRGPPPQAAVEEAAAHGVATVAFAHPEPAPPGVRTVELPDVEALAEALAAAALDRDARAELARAHADGPLAPLRDLLVGPRGRGRP